MKRLLPLLIGLSLSGLSSICQAENLVQVYEQAKSTNPELLKAAADRDAAFEKINQSRGVLLPQINLAGHYSADRGYRDTKGNSSQSSDGSLQLSQVLFNMSDWENLSIEQKKAGISEVSYQSAQQTLILNTATAYFNVLRAIDTLKYIEANKKAVYRQYQQVSQQFKVGLTAITDVQNTKAQYDQVLATEVTANNSLNNAVEALRKITGVYYTQLSYLNVNTFKPSNTENIEQLLKQAQEHNLSLLTAQLQQELSRDIIRQAEYGHLPTLSANASTGLNHANTRNPYSPTNSTNGQSAIGLTLSLPLFNGGVISSQVKQAQYNFISDSESLETTNREVVNNVRSYYNNLHASTSTIRAYQQAVISAQSSLDATQAGYKVGTRTIVDVLNATSTLYNAKQNLSGARYDYLISLLNLKWATGTLNPQDLTSLNQLLTSSVSTQGYDQTS